MSRLVRLGALAATAFVLAGPAVAADFDEPRPAPYGVRPGWAPPRFSRADETCRVFVKRRIDADGEEVVRRVRVCDEGPGFDGPPRWHHRPWRAEGFGLPRERVAPPLPPGEVPETW
ncbi:hypothetical protein [Methylobacterium nodulans]|uniref:Uncharacterized protein n=1 Tax=Methylobacterium nodulans (strain LMG 21967 / CNCM I-2342 / ORS 2060) TaxID=460265 RepID=B8IFQ9_METNO|nr:hypothetical protein [Methylobacterium nodulans]ACL59619.1 conserved hypothetical protein [Methylobacterium nodulans ORS 2060]